MMIETIPTARFTPRLALSLSAAILVGACGASQGTHPEDMSASEHRAMADHERELAHEHDGEGASSSAAVATPGDPGSGYIYGVDAYDPASRHRAQAAHHEQLAAEHEAAAEALESFEQAQCAEFPPATRAACPLLGTVESVTDVDGGVQIALAEGVNREAVVDHIRCHLAYAGTQGRQGMPGCPLYLPHVAVAPGAEANTVVLTTSDAEGVAALRERARAHILGE